MASFLSAIFGCCLTRNKGPNSHSQPGQADERTPLITQEGGPSSSAKADPSASHEPSQPTLPRPNYDADALRGIVSDVQSKFINLDSSNLFSPTSSSPLASASARSDDQPTPETDDQEGQGSKQERPLTLVRNLKLHIAQEIADESAKNDPTSKSPRKRVGGGAGGGHDKLPSVHSLKTISRGQARALAASHQGRPQTHQWSTTLEEDEQALDKIGRDEEYDYDFHTAKEGFPPGPGAEDGQDSHQPNQALEGQNGKGRRTRLVDIWSTPSSSGSENERDEAQARCDAELSTAKNPSSNNQQPTGSVSGFARLASSAGILGRKASNSAFNKASASASNPTSPVLSQGDNDQGAASSSSLLTGAKGKNAIKNKKKREKKKLNKKVHSASSSSQNAAPHSPSPPASEAGSKFNVVGSSAATGEDKVGTTGSTKRKNKKKSRSRSSSKNGGSASGPNSSGEAGKKVNEEVEDRIFARLKDSIGKSGPLVESWGKEMDEE
ncbi:hypothetical protein IE53DRAFT_384294 [Violaceomyces palustris]|uniref:Uncharacterized protein n=1 Tax=Violaceomyces palustris TaxID=1673888 RepID=A0ACD0P556_9BASI|nr:hypothetical protein IE53DRAFT_384294 [Violaceomyces palustris]